MKFLSILSKFSIFFPFNNNKSKNTSDLEINKLTKLRAPLKQKQLGILPPDIVCNTDKILLSKKIDSAICVNPTSYKDFVSRGWTFLK